MKKQTLKRLREIARRHNQRRMPKMIYSYELIAIDRDGEVILNETIAAENIHGTNISLASPEVLKRLAIGFVSS